MRIAPSSAFVLALAACGPRIDPTEPETEPSSTIEVPPTNSPSSTGEPPSREVIVGEMCPAATDGRPGVMPTFMRRISWDDDEERIDDVLERNMARQFSVLGWQGKRVGIFTSAGAATRRGSTFAMGAYAGGSACETGGATPSPIPECEQALLSCGLAVAVLRAPGGFGSAPFEEDPEPDAFETGGACTANGRLLVDVDRDGKVESFSAEAFLDPTRGPADEVTALEARKADQCEPRFALRGAVGAADPRDWRGLDIIGVLDLDGDGRLEIIAMYNYQDKRLWAVYSAQSSAARLELVASGEPWSRPSSSAAQPVTEADLPSD